MTVAVPTLFHDPATHKLGRRKPARGFAKRPMLAFADYVRPRALPAPPSLVDYLKYLPSNTGAMGNDALGDCTAAGYGHAIQTWTAANGQIVTPSDDAVVDFYSGSTGYVRGDESTDNGGDEYVVTKYAVDVGMRLPDGTFDKAAAVVSIDPSNLVHVRAAQQLFGGVYTGVELPVSAQRQGLWALQIAAGADAEPGSWGGHCIWSPYSDDSRHLFGGATWGQAKFWTYDWWLAYAAASVGGACYAFVSSSWARPGVVAPSGFLLADLLADASQVAA